MILVLIHTHTLAGCVFTQGPHRALHWTTHITLPTMEMVAATALQSAPSGAGMKPTSFALCKLLHDLAESFIKTLTQNIKTEPGRERRGVSQRRAIKTARSGLLCAVIQCVCVCVYVCMCAVLKEKVSLHQRGPQQQELGHSWVGGLGLI